ncbi:MAG TPA: protoporphyrinogen oxidase, partial [Kofleriaceae bacterium]
MKVAVIGGGFGGLIAARALLRAGIDAHVLEASGRAGGVVETSTVDGYVREHAASSFLGGPADGVYALCHELGVGVDKASPRARARWIYLDQKLRALPRSPLGLATTDLLTWRGKLDLLREPFRPAGAAGRGEADESMHAFAARRFGAEAARAIVSPFVTGVFAADAHDISLASGFPRLAMLDARGGILRGSLAQLADRLRSRLQGHAVPSTPRGLYAARGGLGAVTAALASELGGRLRLNSPISRIEPGEGGVAIDGARWDGAVLAVPAEDGARLLGGRAGELAGRLAGFHRAPAAQVYLGFAEADVPRAADGFGALVATGEDVRVLGIVFESTVWGARAPAGHVLLRCIYGGGRDPEAVGLDDAALTAQARRDVGIVLGAAAVPTHASVVRWPRGVAQYRLGHADRVREAVALARGQRIAL